MPDKTFLQKLRNTLLQPVTALAAGVLTTIIIILCTSAHPGTVIAKFFAGPFSSTYYFGCMLNTAGLLLLSAMGADLAIQSGSMNLGGEGQVYAGGFLAAMLLYALNKAGIPGPVALLLAAAAVCLVTGGLTLISHLLSITRNVTVLLSSFLISQALIPVINGAIAGPARDTTGNLLATPFIPVSMRFSQIMKPSLFNTSFFIVVVLFAVYALFLGKTRTGRQLIITGTAGQFARYTGMPTVSIQGWSLFASGALHGLTGFFAVTGAYYTCHNGFYSGMGWNALTVALIAARKPVFLAPSALLLAYLFTASNKATLSGTLNFDLPGILQGIILFFITAQIISTRRRNI